MEEKRETVCDRLIPVVTGPMHKKGKFPTKKGKKLSVPPKGSCGLIVTCDPIHTNQAVEQVVQLCCTYTEHGDEDEDQQTSRFIPYLSEVPGNFFVRFAGGKDDPFTVLSKYFDALKETGRSTTIYVVRLYPIRLSGFPSSEESLPLLGELTSQIFKPDHAVVYEVLIQRKHKGEKETHEELNKKIVELVGAPHKPVFHGADTAILWISLGRNLYMSVVDGKWKEWCGCNVPKFCAKVNMAKNE
jgi:hypothetical protein